MQRFESATATFGRLIKRAMLQVVPLPLVNPCVYFSAPISL